MEIYLLVDDFFAVQEQRSRDNILFRKKNDKTSSEQVKRLLVDIHPPKRYGILTISRIFNFNRFIIAIDLLEYKFMMYC